jgi:hypothetical protein
MAMVESAVRRVFGALQAVDGNTGLPLTRPLHAEAANARLVRNRLNLYVLTQVDGLQEYAQAFETLPVVPPQQVTVTLSDPAGHYFPAQVVVDLPRDPDPANEANEDSLFRPVQMSLYPTPNYGPFPGSAMVRVRAVALGSNDPLPGAVVRVLRDTDGDDIEEVIGRGLTGWIGRTQGEALVPLFGVPAAAADTSNNGGPGGGPGGGGPGGPVIITEFPASVEIIYDPVFDPETDIPDLDDIESRQNALPGAQAEIFIASGRETSVTVAVDIS